MRVLIFTSSGGTAHDASAYSLKAWLEHWDSDGVVKVEHLLEKASFVMRSSVNLYNWIQKHWPWLHQLYWRIVEFEDIVKPGTVIFGRNYLIKLLRQFKPEVIISTHPHINRGHFDLAKRIVGPSLRCITCCTELDGGFGFSRNWVSRKADTFWAITPEVAKEVAQRGYQRKQISVLGPLFEPSFEKVIENFQEPTEPQKPLLVLGAGANGSNNHVELLNALLPLTGRIRIVALCGRRKRTKEQLQEWINLHPELSVNALGFQGPKEMAEIYKEAWAMVARPGARTATEALAAGCVLIFNGFGSTMPQELLARRYFHARGIDISIDSPSSLLVLILDWLENPQKYCLIQQAYRHKPLVGNRDAIRQMILGSA